MRYIVFAYDDYYPLGGPNDMRFTSDSLEEAQCKARDLCRIDYAYDVSEVLDTETMSVVYRGRPGEEVNIKLKLS